MDSNIAFRNMLRQRRLQLNLTQLALSVAIRECGGAPASADTINRIENGTRPGSEETLESICHALDVSLVSMRAAAEHDVRISEQLAALLNSAQGRGLDIRGTAKRVFGQQAESEFTSESVAQLLIEDMRSDRTQTIRCQNFLQLLIEQATESQCQTLRQLIGWLASCAVNVLPEIDGYGLIGVTDLRKAWSHYVSVDANKLRPAYTTLRPPAEPGHFSDLEEPAGAVQLPLSHDVESETETATKAIAAINTQMGNLVKNLDTPDSTSGINQSELKGAAKRINRQIKRMNQQVSLSNGHSPHVLMYSDDPTSRDMLSLIKRNYLPALNIFDDFPEHSATALHCDEDCLGDFIRACFRDVDSRENELYALLKSAPTNTEPGEKEPIDFHSKVNQVIIMKNSQAHFPQQDPSTPSSQTPSHSEDNP